MMAPQAKICSDAVQPNKLRYAQWNLSQLFGVFVLFEKRKLTYIYIVLISVQWYWINFIKGFHKIKYITVME
jgi:hypothetical protein